MSEHVIDLFPHSTGTISKNMGKRIILSMDVRHEMLGTFRKV